MIHFKLIGCYSSVFRCGATVLLYADQPFTFFHSDLYLKFVRSLPQTICFSRHRGAPAVYNKLSPSMLEFSAQAAIPLADFLSLENSGPLC